MKAIFLIACIITLSLCKNYTKEENVYVLEDDTFDDFMKLHDYVLVKFYAPWCGHCKRLAPEYSKAAATLEKENLILAQVDATAQHKLASKNSIRGYPTVKLFYKGVSIDYDSSRTETAIVNWMRNNCKSRVKYLENDTDIESFKEKNSVALVYFGKDKENIDEIEKSSFSDKDFNFAVVKDSKLFKKSEAKEESFVIFKKFDEKRNDLNEKLTMTKIKDFVTLHGFPVLITLKDDSAKIIFDKSHPGLILFRDDKSEKTKELDKLMESLSGKLKGRIKVAVGDIKSAKEKNYANQMSIYQEQLPTIRIADTQSGLKKYKLTGEITEKNILDFVKDWESKKLEAYLKSQPLPKTQKEPVYTVVGDTFKKDVLDSKNDVLVKFYAPWCGHCKRLAPTYIELAKKLAHNKKLVIAEMDATANEAPGIRISGFPTIKFFPDGKKTSPVDYDGERTVEAFEKFLQEHATNKINLTEDDKKSDL